MFPISVVIRTHNPRENYLGRVLEALKGQTLPKEQWELLLVDNASEMPLANRVDLSWHPNARRVRENKTGFTPARLCGIQESKADLIIFVNDDNVLRPDYLEVAWKISLEQPKLGAWSGSSITEYETEPPEGYGSWLEQALRIEKLSTPILAKLPQGNHATAAGTGMVIRRKQAMHYRELVLRDPLRQALDRSGELPGECGDSDMALAGFDLGFGTGRFPELELIHLIPASRLTLEYIAGVHEGFAYGETIVNALHDTGVRYHRELPPVELPGFIQKLDILISAKNRIDRCIRLAQERGRSRAKHDLKKLGYQPPKPAFQ